MTAWTRIRLVAARDLREVLRSRAYWVTMAILVLAVVAAAVVPRLVGGDAEYRIGTVGLDDPAFESEVERLAGALDVGVELVAFDDLTDARRAVEDDDVEIAVVPGRAGAAPELLRRGGSSNTAVGLASQAVVATETRARLVDAGLDPDGVARALGAAPPTEVTVDEEQGGRDAVAYFVSLVLYIAILMGGLSVATGVAVEKSSRISEVLVASVRPAQLLTGKVLGIGTSTLLLVLAGAAPFSVAVLAGAVDVPSVAAFDAIAAIGWFLLGFAIFATAMGALGALVDRQEDVGSVVGPLTTVLIASFLLAFQAQQSPGSLLATVSSTFPLSAPIVMPVRIASGDVPVAQIALTVGLGLATVALFARVGGTVYRRALLRGGRRLTVREVLRG